MEPKRFGPFILERLIGRGGMGAVYRAHHEETGQTVAVKALLLPLEQERDRFEAEISTLKLLRCENIVKLYGFGQEDGILYYAMEYIDGPSLSTLLRQGRRFTWEQVVYIGASVCKALRHAHDRGVVHRDVKPANIMLLADGSVKVSDYGIAQYFGASRLTGANQVVGTIDYMAPEQAQAGALTPRADVYSLGALMYALLTGKPPYSARSLAELLRKYREEPPEPIRAQRPETPKVVENVIFELLEIRPENRPSDARLIGRRLEGLLKTSANCPNGNPFLNERFSSEQDDGSSDGSSRVDLTAETNETRATDYPENVQPDFPYRPIDDEPKEQLAFQSPFDKTTEQAAIEQETGERAALTFGPDADEEDDDFILLEEETSPRRRDANETLANARREEKEERRGDDLTAPSTQRPAATSVFDPNDRALVKRLDQENNMSTEFDLGPQELGELGRAVDPLSRAARDATTAIAAPTVPLDAPTPMQKGLDVSFEALDDAVDVKATPLEEFKRSRFTPVAETELGDLPQEQEEAPFFMRFRFWGLAFSAIATTALFVFAMRPPSADALYEKIDRALSQGGSNAFKANLRRSRSDLQRFLDLFPNDERAAKANFFLNELELDDFERKLQGLAREDSSQPLERLYLDAAELAQTDPERAIERFQAFVALFGSDVLDDDETQKAYLASSEDGKASANPWKVWNGASHRAATLSDRLALLAQKRIVELRTKATKTQEADLDLLKGRLENLSELEKIDPEKAKAMRDAANVLYGDKPWAQETLDELKNAAARNNVEDPNASEETVSEQDAEAP